MREASRRERVDVHAFVLMTTHFHLLVTPQYERALARFMQRVNGQYARYFNRQHGRIGTLWNGRYRGIHIWDERYLLTCLRYIEQNPVRAQIVLRPELYPWSSYRVHAAGEPCDWLVLHDCYLRLGPTPAARQTAYRAICGIPLTESELKLHRKPPRSLPLPSDPYV
jgi:putative transposase